MKNMFFRKFLYHKRIFFAEEITFLITFKYLSENFVEYGHLRR